MNFSPEMLNNFKHMINPQMMRQMGQSINGMSDDQLGSMLASMGMGHISPQMYRSMYSNMNNMSDKDLENLKNTPNPPPNFNPNRGYNSNINTKPNPNPTPSNHANSNLSETKKSNEEKKPEIFEKNLDEYLCNDKTKIALKKLENIKNEGNTLFKANKYNQACEKYYEVLNELDYLVRDTNTSSINEIESLEQTCRLNISTCKLKTGDNDLAINECLKILKKNAKNFKAHFKAGTGYLNKKNYEKALYYFENFKRINPDEETDQISIYLAECKNNIKTENIDLKNERKEVPVENNKTKAPEIDLSQNIEKNKQTEKFIKIENNESNKKEESKEIECDLKVEEYKNDNQNNSIKKDKLKDLLENELKMKERDTPKENNREKIKKTPSDNSNEILIEEENSKKQNSSSRNNSNGYNSNSQQNFSPSNSFIPSTGTLDTNKVSEARERLKNMNDHELDDMSNMFKNMDNNMIKSMMQMQGMNLSDDQINLMKNGMNSQMMRMAASQAPMSHPIFSVPPNQSINQSSIGNLNNENSINQTSNNQERHNAQTATFPNMNNLGNMDMGAMMDFVQKNPQLLNMMGPQMSNMFGGDKNIDPNIMMNSMQTIFWIISLPSRIKQFFSSTRGKLLIVFIIIMIVSYFYR